MEAPHSPPCKSGTKATVPAFYKTSPYLENASGKKEDFRFLTTPRTVVKA